MTQRIGIVAGGGDCPGLNAVIIRSSHATRVLAILEAATGTSDVTILIARLVAMYSAGKRPGTLGD